MNNGRDFVEVRSNGSVFPKRGTNPRTLYAHQTEAMRCMDRINQESSYSTLIVLPTGGGKTYTAALWLLKNAIDRKKKILWIAHRQMLLDQAAEWFRKNGIPLYAVNENPGQKRWTSSPKVHADLYIDDSSLGCPLRFIDGVKRPVADWVRIREQLVKEGFLD